MVDLAGAYDPNAEAGGGDFEAIPAGQYTACIIDAERAPQSTREGAPDHGDVLKLTWKITEGEYANRLIWQRLNLWWTGPEEMFSERTGKPYNPRKIAEGQFASIREAIGINSPKTTDEILERPCRITVKVRPATGQYRASNDISNVKALGGAVPAARAPRPQSTGRPTPPGAGGGTVFQRAKAAQRA
ncbi:DUF669 domain-containing protein [Acuticoccus sp. M5D2P5]|uniref:DUF669 domain-containing protein n=1 Tax=Acuticoccus kalidii TaxID=2910977 RepID=UPI001F361008|nr:DUF669 domain-containing protein [Acuticoccus kalidii]MCF3934318.1 DUF669 domain-containing protein [Acuticoccus kalidii]